MHLLLLEDDIDLGQAVTDHLLAHGHEVSWFKLCDHADKAMRRPGVDLVLLDLRLPDGDALDLLVSWRTRGEHRPVIALTARDRVSDRIRGLQAGADDYLVKPFDLDELLARVDAVARRAVPEPPQCLQVGKVTLELSNKQAFVAGEAVTLTAMEWAVVSCLSRRMGHILSRDAIRQALSQVTRGDTDSNSLEVIISRLRRKLGPELISTHRGLGYRLEA